MADTFDPLWKSVLRRDLADFVAFFFPQLSDEIDWDQPRRLRDKELNQFRRDGRPRILIADLLVSVFLRDGREVLLHVEVQAQRDPNLARRILAYNYGLFDEFGLPVASLVLLADAGKRWRPNAFHNCVLGTEMGIRFAAAKLSSYAELVDELLLERNIFAWVAAAHLLAQRTHGKPQARYIEKWRVVRLLYERGWHRRRIINLFKVIDGLMALPPELQERLRRNIVRLERRRDVEWISPMFQLCRQEGLQEGQQKGRQEGRQEGRREGAMELLERQLHWRFGALSPTVQKRLAKATPEQLAQWSEAVLDARTLKQVFSSGP